MVHNGQVHHDHTWTASISKVGNPSRRFVVRCTHKPQSDCKKFCPCSTSTSKSWALISQRNDGRTGARWNFQQVVHPPWEKEDVPVVQFVRSSASISWHSSGGCGLQEGGQQQLSSHRRWVAWLDQNVITPLSQCHTTQQNLTAASKWSLPNELTLCLEQCRTHSLEKYCQSVIFLILLVQTVQASKHLWHAASSGSSALLFGGMAAVIGCFSSSVSHSCWQ